MKRADEDDDNELTHYLAIIDKIANKTKNNKSPGQDNRIIESMIEKD